MVDIQEYLRISREREKREVPAKIKLREEEIHIANWFVAKESDETCTPDLSVWMTAPDNYWDQFLNRHKAAKGYPYRGTAKRVAIGSSKVGRWLIVIRNDQGEDSYDPNYIVPTFAEWLRDPDGHWQKYLKKDAPPKPEPTSTTVPTLKMLRTMPSIDFEHVVADMFTKRGYCVTRTPASNDGGRDLVMTKNGRKVLVECKRYAEGNLIGRPDIQKFHSAILTEPGITAKIGFFVTTSSFSRAAMHHVQENNVPITLIDGTRLVQMMDELL